MDTRDCTNPNLYKYKGFPSFRNKATQERWNLKNTGYQYKDNLLKNSISPYLFKNPKVEEVLLYINKIIVHLIDSVKDIQFFNNYAMDKQSYNRINI